MKICGIIVEYNPFHNGHKIQMDISRDKTGADLIVCVMSGNFVQRGQPAIFDKWTRTICALSAGADAVVELPFLNAVQSAQGFAMGGVQVLDAVGADYLSFGCETDDIDALSSLAKTFSKEPRKYKRALKTNLKSGMSFPKARMLSAISEEDEVLSLPNAILAVEYLSAIIKNKSKLQPLAVKRVGQGYHSADLSTNLSSATAIRSAIKAGEYSSAYDSMPSSCKDILEQQRGSGLLPVFPESFDKELIFRLRVGGVDYIKTLHEVSEGLQNRIFEAAKTSSTRQELIEKIKTKRYTYTRISRILLYALFGITRDIIEKHNRKKICEVRVLGVSNSNVLSALSKSSKAKIVMGKSASFSRQELASSDVYALTQNSLPYSSAAQDYTQKLIILE